ncbi:sensor histidine kinase [Myroides odoratimimus]|uniref:sensor histidine kinase n=1 Tax=Myroides odoratimimus TaxID=76832 RepID=UPI00257739F7|nr:histidine kinase [Myroides odoratimimus]MDM1401734.1 histidine kinase [Myroides odoratimimus]MEC4094971.1 histidine kinase [Myroides odoratimimus]
MENKLELFFWLGTFIMISLAIMVIIIVVIYQKRINQYQNDILKEQLRTNLIVEHKERERIAKELHDGICSDLGNLKNLMILLNLSEDQEEIAKVKADLYDGIIFCYEEAVRISYNLSPPLIKDNTITELLNNYVTRVSKVTSIKFDFNSTTASFVLSDIQKLELYRIVQELTQNILKHSGASFVEIYLVWSRYDLVLYLLDDGVEYDFNVKSKSVGLGLYNIKTRIDQIKAKFSHESTSKGNQISITLNKQSND